MERLIRDENNPEYQASLKSIETENYIDRKFYRPIGFYLAKKLEPTGITPNAVTIISIFVGLGGGLCFLHTPYHLAWALAGIVSMVIANILDCVDGQLARLTGIKSEIGRILDGMAGDLWFGCIYTCFVIRLYAEWGGSQKLLLFLIVVALLSAISHLIQAAITDYYKTLHLFFISTDKGKEFETSAQVKARIESMPAGINKMFTQPYYFYTKVQESISPSLQNLLATLRQRFPNGDIAQELRLELRQESRKIMPLLDQLTFNGRTLPLFFFVLIGQIWLYFVFEILILNIILLQSVRKHEAMCRRMSQKLVSAA